MAATDYYDWVWKNWADEVTKIVQAFDDQTFERKHDAARKPDDLLHSKQVWWETDSFPEAREIKGLHLTDLSIPLLMSHITAPWSEFTCMKEFELVFHWVDCLQALCRPRDSDLTQRTQKCHRWDTHSFNIFCYAPIFQRETWVHVRVCISMKVEIRCGNCLWIHYTVDLWRLYVLPLQWKVGGVWQYTRWRERRILVSAVVQPLPCPSEVVIRHKSLCFHATIDWLMHGVTSEVHDKQNTSNLSYEPPSYW